MRYMFWCANEHVDFRVPEFEAIARIFDIDLKWVEKTLESGAEREPWVVIDLDSEDTARKLISRSISTRFCVELWAQSDHRQGLHDQVKTYADNHDLSRWFSEDVSFKVHAEAFMKKYTMREKLDRIEAFKYLPFQGKVNLTNPDLTLTALEFYGFDHNNLPEEPFQVNI